MKTIIYSRVSTDKQSCDSQMAELRDYAQRKGWIISQEITDTISGSKFERQGLDELMTMIRAGKVAHVLCFKLDRLGRSLRQLAQTIHEFTSNGVALVIPSQGIDTSTDSAASKLQLNVLMAIAEFERSMISERVCAGLRAAKARGVRLGKKPLDIAVRLKVSEILAKGKGTRETDRLLKMPVSTVQDIKKGMAA
jgi:DNA invertase Pin-like site-specific DNA recombinase